MGCALQPVIYLLFKMYSVHVNVNVAVLALPDPQLGRVYSPYEEHAYAGNKNLGAVKCQIYVALTCQRSDKLQAEWYQTLVIMHAGVEMPLST